MSRVGLSPVKIDKNFSVSIENEAVNINYKGDVYKYLFEKKLNCKIEEDKLFFSVNNELVSNKSNLRYLKKIIGFHVRDLTNLLSGLLVPFKKTIEVVGVGYKVLHDKQNNLLTFSLGYSHDIVLLIPEKVNVEVVQNKINLSCSEKNRLGMFFSYISRSLRKFDKFKGKGLIRVGEYMQRKEFKKK